MIEYVKKENWNGFQTIHLGCHNKHTQPKKIFYDMSYRVSPLVHLDSIKHEGEDNEVCYYLIHHGGGYLSNERLATNIILDEGARGIVTTTSPANIYFSKPTEHAESLEYIEVNKDAYLTYICDDIIAYEHSRYVQRNEFELKSHCHLIYSDVIGPGWSSKDNNFTFDWVKLRSQFKVDGKLFCIDNLQIDPKLSNLLGSGNFNGYKYLAAVVVFDDLMDANQIHLLREFLQTKATELKAEMGITKLDGNACVAHILTSMEQHANKIIMACVNWVRTNLWKVNAIDLKKF